MGSEHLSPSSRSSFESDANARKRVCKACDRCRMKKSKCDGNNPCSRCKADNAICQFGERKKSHDKVYPKGYVEMLEQQQHQLVAGLRELYRRLQAGEGWEGAPLDSAVGGHPLTHDILERLDLLQQSPDSPIHLDHFEEEPERLQELLVRNGAPQVGRRPSLSPPEESEPPSPPLPKTVPSRTSYPSPNSLNTSPRSLTPAAVQQQLHPQLQYPKDYSKFPSTTQFVEPAIFEPEQQYPVPNWLSMNGSQVVDSPMAMNYDTMWDSTPIMASQAANPMFNMPPNVQNFGAASTMAWPTPNEVTMNDFIDFSNCSTTPSAR